MPELISFAIIWFLLTIPLGQNAIITMDASFRYGWSKGLLVPLGITIASLIYSLLSITVLAYIFNLSPNLLRFAIVLGSLYLFYLSYKILIRPVSQNNDTAKNINSKKLILLGLTTSLSNPKAALVYLSVLPSLIQKDTIEPFIIITTIATIVFTVYFCYSCLANLFRNYVIGFPYRQKFIDILASLSFSSIAIKNIYDVIMQLTGA